MAANWEMQLISAIVRADNPSEAYETTLEQGVLFKTFGGIEAKSLWSTIEAHYRRPRNFGHVPSEASLQEQFPNLDLPGAVENLVDLCDKVRTGFVKRESEKAIQHFLDAQHADPHKAVTSLYSHLGEIQEQTSQSEDVTFSQVAMSQALDGLKKASEGEEGLTGMPWPWMKMNKATGGIQNGDFIMVWALPKSMKTWLGLVVAAHVLQTGRRVLIYSKEMTWETMHRRICSILAEVNYTKLKEGTLSRRETAHYLECIERIVDEDFPGELFFTNADRSDGSPGGPAEIRRKIEVYRPHFILLDSSYMLELPGVNTGANALDWKQLSVINRQLKQIAKSTGIPVMAILQENERSALKYTKSRGTASLAMNTGAVMDCDVGIRLVYHKRKQELTLQLAAARETTEEGFTINAIASENFRYAHDELHSLADAYADEESEEANAPQRPPAQAIASPLMAAHSRSDRSGDEVDDDLEADHG
jgi:hypothetical protein